MRHLALFALAGCTCLQPVEEQHDGGHAGGTASAGGVGGAGGAGGTGSAGGGASAGGTAHADGGCTVPGDCHGDGGSVNFCGIAGGLGWSCIAGACLWECNGGRVCDVTHDPDGGCITCSTPGTECRQSQCGNVTRHATVESSTCSTWPGTSIAFTDVTVTGGAACRFDAYQAAGVQQLGMFEELADGQFLADFPGFGGQCTGSMLPTGAERWVFNCPGCLFVLRF